MPRYKQPADIPPGSKFCIACKAVLPVASFSPEATRPDGLRPYCKPCASRRVQISKAKRRFLAMAGKLATRPASVSPAEREAHNAAFLAAWDGLQRRVTAAAVAHRHSGSTTHH